jgi:hypothetical protein
MKDRIVFVLTCITFHSRFGICYELPCTYGFTAWDIVYYDVSYAIGLFAQSSLLVIVIIHSKLLSYDMVSPPNRVH